MLGPLPLLFPYANASLLASEALCGQMTSDNEQFDMYLLLRRRPQKQHAACGMPAAVAPSLPLSSFPSRRIGDGDAAGAAHMAARRQSHLHATTSRWVVPHQHTFTL